MNRKKLSHTALINNYRNVSRRSLIIGIFVFLAIIVMIDLTPLGGNIKFYTKWVSCGQKPVGVFGPGFKEGHPGYYKELSVLSLTKGYGPFFCSPLDAEKAGYSASPDRYEFPHLHNK